MNRMAECQCGAFRVETGAEPSAVVVCSCRACQRRSGSVFGAGAYFAKDELRITGESREYVRPADSGKPFHEFFCPSCGSTLYWFSGRDPERIGIAVGAFADPHFPSPSRSVFDETKHDWVRFGDQVPGHLHGRNSERTR